MLFDVQHVFCFFVVLGCFLLFVFFGDFSLPVFGWSNVLDKNS